MSNAMAANPMSRKRIEQPQMYRDTGYQEAAMAFMVRAQPAFIDSPGCIRRPPVPPIDIKIVSTTAMKTVFEELRSC